ncbi:MAG: tetratricopeptide repeat protein [Candidatus Neomarinimicrobiota bacterium]
MVSCRFSRFSIFGGTLCLFFFATCSTQPSARPEITEPEVSGSESSLAAVNPEALKHFMDGEMLLVQGNYPMAILEFQDALIYDSSAPAILTSLAEAYMKLGKFERAEAHLLEAISHAPKNREARELLGHQYLIRGQVDKAEREYELLKEFYPASKEFSYVLGEIALRKGELESAQEQFWKIYQEDTMEVRALQRAAGIARDRGDLKFAFEAFEILTDFDPENAQFWRAYSELAVVLERYQSAISGLERLTDLTSDDPQILERLAIVYFDNNEVEKADSVLHHLYDDGHKSPGVFYYLGRIAMSKEEYETLESQSSEFIESFPHERSGYTHLAMARINLDKTLGAISTLLKARELFPDDFAVNYLLGNSYTIEENYLLAKESLLSALKIEPESRVAKHLLATIYNHLEEWESSDGLYRELLEGEGNDSQALNNYSYTLAERDVKLDSALQMAQKAIVFEPENPAYLDTIGWIYFKMGEYQKALQYIEKSLNLEDDNSVVLEHFGDVLVKLNRNDLAREYYQKALEIDTGNQRLLEKIESE